jgi:hypothetical protein
MNTKRADKTGDELAVLAREPPWYPSRYHYAWDPGVPDRQLWAIGMIVVQWSLTEFLREQITFNLMVDDATLIE